MNYKNGDKVVTTGNIPHDNTKCVKAGLNGVVLGRDTDGKYKVAIDGETEPWYLAEHEIKRAAPTFNIGDAVKFFDKEDTRVYDGEITAVYNDGTYRIYIEGEGDFTVAADDLENA